MSQEVLEVNVVVGGQIIGEGFQTEKMWLQANNIQSVAPMMRTPSPTSE